MSIKTLTYTLITLLLIFIVIKLSHNDYSSGDLPENVFTADTNLIDKIVITTKNKTEKSLTLQKENDKWMVETEEGTLKPVVNYKMSRLFRAIQTIKPQRIVSKNEKNWQKYDVSDSLAKRLQIFQSNKEIGNLLIGKINFNSNSGTPGTYLRLEGNSMVYDVNNTLSMEIYAESRSWRNNTILELSAEEIIKISYEIPPDTLYVWNKKDGSWYYSDMPIESDKSKKLLEAVTKVNSSNFWNNQVTGSPSSLLTIETQKTKETLTFYSINGKIVVQSTQNQSEYFEDSKLFNNINKVLKAN